MCVHNRRAADRYSLSTRMGWALMDKMDRIKRDAADILGSIVVGSFVAFCGLVVITWVRS